jgi:hypothetical protein
MDGGNYALIASAWVAVCYSSYWRGQFQALAKRLGKSKAITVIARKFLVTIWRILSKRQADHHHADAEAIVRSFIT